MNYLLFKAFRARDALGRYQPRVSEMENIERWARQATAIRNQLVAAHLPAVLAVAQRHWFSLPPQARSAVILGDLLQLGQDVLIDGVRTFDPSRERSFEMYLNWSLMRAIARHAPDTTAAQRRLDERQLLTRLHAAAGKAGITLPDTTDNQ